MGNALFFQCIHLPALRIVGQRIIIIRRLPFLRQIVGEQHRELRFLAIQLLHRSDKGIAVPLIRSGCGHLLIGRRLLRAQILESALDPSLRFLRRRLSKEQRLRQILCHLARLVVVDRILQDVASFVVRLVAAALHDGLRALCHLLDLPAAEWKRQIGRRVCQLVYYRLHLLLRGNVLVAGKQCLFDVPEVRNGRRNRNASAVNLQPQLLIQSEHRERLRPRQLADEVSTEIFDRLICSRLLLRELPPARERRLHRVRHLIPCEISHAVIEDVQRIERRASAHDGLIDLIVEPSTDQKLKERLCKLRQAFFLLLRDHILKDPAQFVVDLQLELRKELDDRISRRVDRRRRAFAAVCHDVCRELVCLLHRVHLAHANPDVLQIPCPDDASGRKSVDGFHQKCRLFRNLVHGRHREPPIAAAVVDEG